MSFRILLCALAASASLAHASQIVPAEPASFEPVNLRMTTDGCTFVPESVQVSADANVIRVRHRLNACLVPGPVQVTDIRLGSLAPGSYTVEVYNTDLPNETPAERLRFDVREPARIAVFPPPPRPIAGYTGLWWNPEESGWGLSIQQSHTDVLLAQLFIYGTDNQPVWFAIQPAAGWRSSTRWEGTVYRTAGPYFAGPDFDPRLVLIQAAGTASLEFAQAPGSVGRAVFTYTIGGVTTTKTITRMVY